MKDIQTSDTIQLTRIHALDWYGFSDSFDLVGQTLITGVYGCGKTALIDLVQTVLLGPPDHENRYNLSVGEVGGTSREVKRDLRGYALQDLNVMHDGNRVFARPNTRTYIALEWTWPGSNKHETWGLRIEFASSGADHDIDFWHVPVRLEFDDFIQQQDNGDQFPLDGEAWLKKVIDLHGHRYPTKDLYLEAIAAAQHLNFEARVFKPLLLQTLRFSFGRNFDEFCREHILAETRIDIETVRESYDRYRDFAARIRLLEEQQQVLEKISVAFTRYHLLGEEIEALGWFQQKLRLEERLRESEKAAAEYETIRAASAKWDAEVKELRAKRTAAEDEEKTFDRTLAELPHAQEFKHFKLRQRALPAEIEQLALELENPADAVRQQCERLHTLAAQAISHAARHGWDAPALSNECPQEVPARLDSAEIEELALRFEAFSESLAESWKDIAKLADNELKVLESREISIRQDIARLRENRGTGNLLLRDALEKKFGRERIQLIGDLCEVTDETWADALEINFAHKLASLVPDEEISSAFQLFNSLPEVNPRERLLCRADLYVLSGRVESCSLAEKITSDDVAVSQLIAHLFGAVHCCESVEDAEGFPRAVLHSGAIKELTGRRRQRATPSEYAIGRKGREKMISRRESDLADLARMIEMARRKARDSGQVRDGFLNVKTTLLMLRRDKVAKLRRLEQLRAEQIDINSKLDLLPNRDALEDLRRKSRNKHQEVEGFTSQIQTLVDNAPASRVEKELAMQYAREAHSTAETEALSWQIEHPNALAAASKHGAMEAEARQRATSRRAASDACDDLVSTRREERANARGNLLRWRQQLHDHPRIYDFRDSDIEDLTTNTLWDKKLVYIVETGIKDFTRKMEEAEIEWEERFQKNILGQLFEQLGGIRQTFRGLQHLITGRTIGGARYGFTYAKNDRSDFNLLRSLASDLELHNGFLPGSAEAIDVRIRRRDAMKLFEILPGADAKTATRQRELLDPRYYFTYDLEITEAGRSEPVSLNARGRKGSGGETYNPYLIALITAYMRAFNRHENSTRPSISLLLMDEAFKVNDSAAVRDCLNIIAQLGLQGVISCTNTVGSQVIEYFQWAMIVQKQVVPAAMANGTAHDSISNTVYAAPKNDPEVLRVINESVE